MQVTGRVFVKINGALLTSKSGAKLNVGGVERKPVLGDLGVSGYAEATVAPFVECTISHRADTDLEALRNFTAGTLTFETDTGKSYVLRDAWLENPPELTGGEGDVALRFTAVSAEPVS